MVMEQLVMVCRGRLYNIIFIITVFNVDIDECSEDTNGCSQICNNTEGSFTCGCNDGYLLDSDGITCNGMYTGRFYINSRVHCDEFIQIS